MIIADGKVVQRIGFGESCSVDRGCVCVCVMCEVAHPRGWQGVEDGLQPLHPTMVLPRENVFLQNTPLIATVSSAVLLYLPPWN